MTETTQTNIHTQHIEVLEDDDYTDGPQNDPYKNLPKSTMNLSLCKNYYFLEKEKGENYFVEKFWSVFDKEGYSIHHGFYKYNDEFSPLAFIRRNVVSGIIQSMDSTIAHKNLFGVFKLFSNKTLECVFVTRGVEILKECTGDMIESFNFVKFDTEKIEHIQFVSDFFDKEEGDDIEFYTRFV